MEVEPGDEEAFEAIYAAAGEDLKRIPWASLSPHPALVSWLDGPVAPGGQTALVVGCGLGDDAEALSARGYGVTAFDVAPTAIALCQERFPQSTVDYRVADLFAVPVDWRATFDLVVEVRTLQSLPPAQRARAIGAIADATAPGGLVWVRCLAREDAEPVTARPWPVSRRELRAFAAAGLRELEFRDEPAASGVGRVITAVYQKD